MAVRNQDFYDLNESRPWPLSDEASGIDDDGARLPGRFLADLHLSYPLTAGRRAMLSAVSITRKIATVTILATDSVSSPSGFTPLAAISLPKPIDPHRMYPLEALYPGAGGWIVFGSAAAETNADAEEYRGRFTTPAQSILLPSTSRAYESLPVRSMSRLGNLTKLTGLVRLIGGSDIEIVKECREIPSNPPPTGAPLCAADSAQVRDVIVIRLKQDTDLGAVERNIFDEFKGPCGGRPESRSCGDPEPIEFITSVAPDCCGNIDIRMRGCASLTTITSSATVADEVVVSTKPACGVIIDCNLGLTEACVTPDRLPDADGNLPNEPNDLCESETSITLPDLPPDEPEESESITIIEESESVAADSELPFCDEFTDSDLAPMELQAGYFSANASPLGYLSSEGSLGAGQRNIATWDESPKPTLYKRVSAQFTILAGSTGQGRNAAVVTDWGIKSGGTLTRFFFAELDLDSQATGSGTSGKLFRIGVFDGNNYITLLSASPALATVGNRYNICLSVFPSQISPGSVSIFAQLTGLDDATNIQIQTGDVGATFKNPGTGKFGIMSDRSATRFHQFCVENTGDDPTLGCTGEPSGY